MKFQRFWGLSRLSWRQRPGPDPPDHYILWCPPLPIRSRSRSFLPSRPSSSSRPIRSPVSQMLPIPGDLVTLPGGWTDGSGGGGGGGCWRAPDRVSWSPLPGGRGPWWFGVMTCGAYGLFLIIWWGALWYLIIGGRRAFWSIHCYIAWRGVSGWAGGLVYTLVYGVGGFLPYYRRGGR